MSTIKLITEKVPKPYQLLITYPDHPLAQEIIHQLAQYPNIEIVTCSDPLNNLPSLDNPGVIIHLAGFDSPSLSQTLSLTVILHRLISLATQNRCLFLLLVPATDSHLYHSSLTLITQYARSFPLQYKVLRLEKKSPSSSIAADIIKTFIHRHRPPTSISSSISSPPPPPPFRTLSPIKAIRIFLGFIFALTLLFLTQVSITFLSLYCSSTFLRTSNSRLVTSCSHVLSSISRLNSFQSFLFPPLAKTFSLIGLPSTEISIYASSLRTSLEEHLQLNNINRALYTSLLTPEAPPPQLPSQLQLSYYSETLAQLQTHLDSLFISSRHPPAFLSSLSENLNSARQISTHLQTLHPDLTTILSAPEYKILILVQDNTELRPTGGFIDTLILLTLQHGHVVNYQITSSASADSRLAGSVSPPSDFARITKNNTWTLRDSNWDPDFSVSARRASWFIDKELGFSPDLVIALNLTTFQSLLETIGPSRLDEIGVLFTSQNFYSLLLSSFGQHPSTPTPVFLLTSHFSDRLKSLTSSQISNLYRHLFRLLETGQIYLYPITSSPLNFNLATWSGSFSYPECPTSYPCLSDYAYVVDTNLAQNKSDASTRLHTQIQSHITDTSLITSYTFTYTNTSSLTNWPFGLHKNYLRFYFPLASQLQKIQLNRVDLTSSQYTLSPGSTFQSLGLWVTTDPGQSSILSLEVSQPLPASPQFRYRFLLPSQPGRLNSHLSYSLQFPSPWQSKIYFHPDIVTPGSIQYNPPIHNRPLLFQIDFLPPR